MISYSIERSCKCVFNLIGDDGEAFADCGFVHGEGDANALAGVRPVLRFAAEEEVVAGDD